MNVEMKSMKYILFLTEFKYSDNRTNIFQAKLLKYTTDFLDKIISIEAILWLLDLNYYPDIVNIVLHPNRLYPYENVA